MEIGSVVTIVFSFETNFFGNFNHDKNYIELCTENYFSEKNH